MFFYGDFIEPARDPDAAPWRWRWDEGMPARARFGARAARAAEGLLRYSFAPVGGTWHRASLREIPGAPDGHRMWEGEIAAPDGEGSCVYETGYLGIDGAEVWGGRRRPLLWSRAPWRGIGAEQIEVGRDAEGPVLGPRARHPVRPAPRDWRKRMHYALMLDRFAIGRPDRRGLGLALHDPASPFAAHGGDIAGVRGKLDYLAALGVGAVILTPVTMGGAEGYHGYHPVDLYALEPRLGTMEELRALVAEAQDRDIAVILDVVVNHMAPMIDWRREDGRWQGSFRYDLAAAGHVPLCPEGMRHPDCFHDPSTDGDMVRGRLFGFLEDWRTEAPEVREALVRSLKYWLAETGVDGFRYDAVRHVDGPFWRHATREIARYASAIGKDGFVQIGEHASDDAAEAGQAATEGGFDGMLDHALYFALRDAMAGDDDAHGRIAEALDRDCFHWADSRRNLVFLENHDSSRALGLLGDRAALAAWLALIFLGPGIPAIAQGQEQEFDGLLFDWVTPDGRRLVSDAYVREDMFANPGCVWRGGPVNRPAHPPYDRTNPTWRLIAELSGLRRRLPGLHAGDRVALRDCGDGVHLHRMGAGADRLLVAINLTAAAAALDLPGTAPLWSRGEIGAGRLGPHAAAVWAVPAP